ncbi:hypothetical protein QOT17_020209 [Balamuthia mandrillaris]
MKLCTLLLYLFLVASFFFNFVFRNVIVSTLLRFDIIFIQELQNGPNDACGQYTGPAICALLAAMNELSDTPYGLNVGPRANGVEQYAILYKEHLFSVEESFPYSPAETFARTPQVVLMKHKPSGNQFWSINIHTQPTKAREEIQALTDVVASLSLDVTDMVVVLGDFNSDGSYFSERKGWPLFFAALGDGWINAIHDDMDTTVAHSDNTYDRIVLSPSLAETLISDSAAVFYYDDPSQGGFSMSAIQKEGCAKKYISQCPATVNEAASKVSDHYPVEVFLDFGGSAASSGSSSKSNGTNDHDHQKQEGEDDEHHQQSETGSQTAGSTDNHSNESEDALGVGAIAGIILSVLFALAILSAVAGLVALVLLRRARRRPSGYSPYAFYKKGDRNDSIDVEYAMQELLEQEEPPAWAARSNSVHRTYVPPPSSSPPPRPEEIYDHEDTASRAPISSSSSSSSSFSSPQEESSAAVTTKKKVGGASGGGAGIGFGVPLPPLPQHRQQNYTMN